jgi:hypothetical protein
MEERVEPLEARGSILGQAQLGERTSQLEVEAVWM